MPFVLPPLPFAEDALEPHMSARTLSFHHGKHHKAYVDKANELIAGTPLEQLPPAEIVRRAHAEGNDTLYNQAAQAWNHDFLWQSLSPDGGGAPGGALAAAIDRDLGGMDAFAAAFTKAATGHFGSGWAWLVSEHGTLKVFAAHDANNPLVCEGQVPLLVLDLWEHAYYLDWQNARPKFVAAFLADLANWTFASGNFGATAA